MSDLAAEGIAILMISSELPEVLGMSDRILVMHEGRVTGLFDRSEATQEKIMLAATQTVQLRTVIAMPVRAKQSRAAVRRDCFVGLAASLAMTPSLENYVTTTSLEKSRPSLLALVARFRELALIGFIVLLMVLISLRNPNFLTITNFRDILLDISILAMVALAQAMIIITRGIDLSVASMLGLTAMMVSFLLRPIPKPRSF